jgi:hypothetical protein
MQKAVTGKPSANRIDFSPRKHIGGYNIGGTIGGTNEGNVGGDRVF